jgi:hypothetical protein
MHSLTRPTNPTKGMTMNDSYEAALMDALLYAEAVTEAVVSLSR